jgi:hypothetical protein
MPPVNEKPSRNEDEYFLKYDAELLKARRVELDAARAAAADAASRGMTCPKDGGELVEREYHHVKIDVCAQCGGVWLDRGELEQLEHVDRRGFLSSFFSRP